MSDTDRILRRFADRQLNLITRKQALSSGVTRAQLAHRLNIGTLQRAERGVFLFGAGTLSFEQRALAACLACGDGAYASGRTAAALWGILRPHDGPISVTVPAGSGSGPSTIAACRSTLNGPTERTVRDRVPIARVNRTLLELARCLPFAALESAVDAAIRQRLTTPKGLLDYLAGRSGKGVGDLRGIARDRVEFGVHDTSFEADAERVLLDHGLPRPRRQVWFSSNGRRWRFDLAYPEQRVAVEPSGESPHWGRDRWQHDHDKRIAAKQARVNMLEFTWDDVHERPLYFVTAVADALGLKPSRWVPKSARRRRPGATNGSN